MEDLQKNFVLLSKIAKEKKYAQEYMGLLARRGDIGSIRIGKRWFTTWQWFEEFLENSQKKKMENVCEPQVAQPAMIEPAEIVVAIKMRKEGMQKKIIGDIGARRETRARHGKTQTGNFVQKKNRNPLPYKEIKFRKSQDVFSPVFRTSEEIHSIFFPRFAFAAGFAIILLLVAVSGYFAYSGGLLARGTVAGASDERNSGFSGISSGGEYFLASAGDKIKESLSVSRVVVEAAKERRDQGNLENIEN